jgi:hypothetical protein
MMMKSSRLHNISSLARMTLRCGVLVLALAAGARGQVNAGDRNRPPKSIPPESSSRPLPGTAGAVIVGTDTAAGEPAERDRARILLDQIKDDFAKIQTIHNEMMNVSTQGKPLDYRYISEVTAEIRKRASRLKTNLKLPASDSPEKGRKYRGASDEAQLKAALFQLDDLMMSFVGNPLFQQAQIVDVKLAARAQLALRGVIEFSQGISKDAERLSKTAGTP